MNRIKEARNRINISQGALAKLLGITQQSISAYENNQRTPDSTTWHEIAESLDVPVQYLKGEIDDPDGWELWEKFTGYSKEEIQHEINRMKQANHIYDDVRTQKLIGQAVMNLDGYGTTDRGILNQIAISIKDLQNELSEKYKDPKKIDRLSKIGEQALYTSDLKIEDIIFDDLNSQAYSRALDILINAHREIKNISDDLDLK